MGIRSPLLLLAALLLGSPPAPAQGPDWNQAGGNAANTAASSYAPVTRTPAVVWRADFEQLLCEPVLFGGVTYVVAMKDRRQSLLAYRTTDGEPLGVKRLGRDAERVHLAVWQGTVIVVGPDGVRTFQHRQTVFKDRHRIKGHWPGAPAVHQGLLLVAGDGLTCIDLDKGKVVAEGPKGHGVPAVLPLGGGEAHVVVVGQERQERSHGDWLAVYRYRLAGADKREPTLELVSSTLCGRFIDPARSEELAAFAPVRLEDGELACWFLRSPVDLSSDSGAKARGLLMLDSGAAGLCPLARPVAVRAGNLFGIADSGRVIQMLGDGRYLDLSEPPPGALAGAASIAGDVVFFGNWAIEIDSKRVLWCDPELQPITPAIPAADGMFVVGFEDGIAALAAPETPWTSGAPGSTAATPSSPKAAPLRPDSGDGAVLADGTWRPGAVPAGLETALIVTGGEVRVTGEQHPVFLAWHAALEHELANALEPLFEEYDRSRFVGDCKRILALAVEHGLDDQRAAAWNGRLVGRSENTSSNAPAQRERIAAGERELLEDAVRGIVEAADWCAAQDLTVAATVLLVGADELVPGQQSVRERARRWVPDEFPWRTSNDAGDLWQAWAVELLPAGAAFVARDDPAWKGLDAPWKQGTIRLRTRNLDFLSRALDPAIVGGCLRSGEGAVRAAARVLGPAAVAGRGPQALERLSVRLHENRDEYLAERTPGGDFAIGWSVGYYSPAERVSRFYVPDPEALGDPLGRDLYKVLAHELTHHYVDRRWLGNAARMGPEVPGYWVVEGFARFLEDQVIEMGRLGTAFDDPTVPSLDATYQVQAQELLIPMADFVDLPHVGFARLSDEPVGLVELRHTLGALRVSLRHVFYEQAGSLVFFLMHRRGPEGRAALLRYLERHYRGATTAPGWKELGFESAEDLERSFAEFLASLG